MKLLAFGIFFTLDVIIVNTQLDGLNVGTINWKWDRRPNTRNPDTKRNDNIRDDNQEVIYWEVCSNNWGWTI